MKLKVVGTLAYDSVKSDFGSKTLAFWGDPAAEATPLSLQNLQDLQELARALSEIPHARLPLQGSGESEGCALCRRPLTMTHCFKICDS